MAERNLCFTVVVFFFFYFCHPDITICCLASAVRQMSQTAKVWEARAWQRGRRSAPHPFLIMKPSLIKAKDNYFLNFFCSVATFLLLPAFPFIYRFSLFLFTAPPCLHHMAADQIMSNILPSQVFAICSFQT